MKTIQHSLKIGQKIYWSDAPNVLYGTIEKVLKRDCRIILVNGERENRQISMILKMHDK